MLEVYIDFKSPYAFVALHPTLELERRYGIAIDWYPLTLNIGSYLGTARKTDSGQIVENNRSPRQWMAVRYAYTDARRYAELQGLVLKGTRKIWDSSMAHIGLLWARQDTSALKRYMDITFERFWRRELDIEDERVIIGLLDEAGCSTRGFSDFLHVEGRVAHDRLQEDILDRGCFGVPTYVIEDEIYFGREHLPRVRWHLEGRPGPLPDVANDTILVR